MGAEQSSSSSSEIKNELFYERGDDSLAVEVNSVSRNEEEMISFTYISDSSHKSVLKSCMQVSLTLQLPSHVSLIVWMLPAR